MITPQSIIEKYSVEEICRGAEDYYQSIPDSSVILGKPFNSVFETPSTLEDVGVLLAGLRLAKTMTVLDFGAGSCWLSRIITQLQCKAIACDPSQTALDLGRQIFEKYPTPGETMFEPEYSLFDGHRIDLPDRSVDRIVCFDTFHHVPNQEEVLAEMSRVLKDGGIAGFREPGIDHSKSPQSQAEMKNYVVLENDIDVNQIFETAKKYQFSVMMFRLQARTELTLEQYNELMEAGKRSVFHKGQRELRNSVMENLRSVMESRSIFYLFKGATVLDSRSVEGMKGSINSSASKFETTTGEELTIPVTLENSGIAKWLHQNAANIGVVNIVGHLYDHDDKMIQHAYYMRAIEQELPAGESLDTVIKLRFDSPGQYKLRFDLLAEQVVWFEHVGCPPLEISVEVN